MTAEITVQIDCLSALLDDYIGWHLAPLLGPALFAIGRRLVFI